MASKEEIQKQNIEEANQALGEQLNLVSQLNDKMIDLTKTLKEKGTLDKLSATAVKEVVTATKNLKSEYDSVKSVQKDIAKNEELTNKLTKQGNALKVEGGKKLEDEVKMLKTRESSLTKAENKLAKMNQQKALGQKVDEVLLKQAEATVLKKQTQLDITLESLSAEAEQLAYIEEAEKANAANAQHLAEQLKRQKNLEKAGGRTVKNTAALGKIFSKLGMSGIGKVFTDASESASKFAYEATNGGKKAIGMFGKLKIAAKGLGAALKVALGPLALITMAIGFMQKLAAKGKEGAAHMRAMSHDTMVMGRELGVSGEKAKELAGQATAIGGAMSMTTGAAKQAAGAVYSALDGAEKVSNKTLQTFIQLNKFAGMSADSIKDIKSLSKVSGQEASKVANAMADQAKSSIVSLKLNTSMKSLMTAVGKVSSNIKLNMAGSAVGITKAVAQAKKLGLEMSQVEGIASSLLNIEDSMQKEMEAELLTGKDLNLEKARAAALNGDNVALMDELAKQGITAADYSKMNVVQQEALAGALGMNRGQMADMLVSQKENVAENVNMVDLQKQGIDAMSSMASAQEKRAKADEDQLLALAGINSAVSRMEAAFIKIKKLLTPLVDLIFTPIFELVADTGELLAGWLGTTTELNEGTGEYVGNIDLIHNVVKGIAIAYVGILGTIKAINIAKAIGQGYNKIAKSDTLFFARYRAMEAADWTKLQAKKVAGWAKQKAHWVADKAQWVALQAKKVAGYASEKAAIIANNAVKAAGFLKDVGIAAMRAISSLASIPIVGIGLGIAAAATVAGLAAKYMNDGIQGPVKNGYSRTMYGPEGAISFNDKDTIIAGTDLGGSGGGNSGGSDNSAELGRIANLLEQLLNKEGGVYIDGNKVGGTIALTNYQQQ